MHTTFQVETPKCKTATEGTVDVNTEHIFNKQTQFLAQRTA